MAQSSSELKERGFRAAVAFVENRGMTVLKTDWTCGYGRVDIIGDDNGTLVFFTVKTRRAGAAGIPDDTPSPSKARKLQKIASVFLKYHEDFIGKPVRYDAINIYAFSEHQALLRYIRDIPVTEIGAEDGEE